MSGAKPTGRRLGQHFLVDRRAAQRIVDALDPHPGEALLEIGPGRGALTAPLLERAPRLVAVELDVTLAAALRGRYAPDRLVLVEEDILRVKLSSIAARLGLPSGSPLVVAGNLPYQVSKPVALKLIGERTYVDRAVLMFQLEVALRLTATPGSKAYGPLTVLAGETFIVRRLFDLGPGAFRPRPQVSSAVTSWSRKPLSALPPAEERGLRACLKVCFTSRRKTLRNNLRAALASDRDADGVLEAAGIDGSCRPEMLPPAAFRRLAAAWPATPPSSE